jgi:hypothetical protein
VSALVLLVEDHAVAALGQPRQTFHGRHVDHRAADAGARTRHLDEPGAVARPNATRLVLPKGPGMEKADGEGGGEKGKR